MSAEAPRASEECTNCTIRVKEKAAEVTKAPELVAAKAAEPVAVAPVAEFKAIIAPAAEAKADAANMVFSST